MAFFISFYDPEVKFLTFWCQMFKIFEFKKAELKDYMENTEADPNFIFYLIGGKIKKDLVWYFFLNKKITT